jgi:hypothetical protein
LCALCFLPFAPGCAKTEPVTKRLHNAAVDGDKDPKQFQYYVSGPITLKKRDTSRDFEIVGGKIKRHTGNAKDTIYINSKTPGVLVGIRHTTLDGKEKGLRYEVRFEADPNCYLIFGEAKAEYRRTHKALYLCYSDPSKRTINYGGVEYNVEVPRGNPWLIIKSMGTKSKRTVSGAKL